MVTLDLPELNVPKVDGFTQPRATYLTFLHRDGYDRLDALLSHNPVQLSTRPDTLLYLQYTPQIVR